MRPKDICRFISFVTGVNKKGEPYYYVNLLANDGSIFQLRCTADVYQRNLKTEPMATVETGFKFNQFKDSINITVESLKVQ